MAVQTTTAARLPSMENKRAGKRQANSQPSLPQEDSIDRREQGSLGQGESYFTGLTIVLPSPPEGMGLRMCPRTTTGTASYVSISDMICINSGCVLTFMQHMLGSN